MSRDHHVALEHALRLRRTSEEDVAAVVAGFLAFLLGPGRTHFAQEEEAYLSLLDHGGQERATSA